MINNLKQLFEIDAEARWVVFCVVNCSLLSFSQLYFLKKSIIDEGVFINIVISITMGILWFLANLIPVSGWVKFIYDSDSVKRDRNEAIKNDYPFIIIFMSLWICMFTYLAYRFNWSFRTLFEIGFVVCFIRNIIGIIISSRRSNS